MLDEARMWQVVVESLTDRVKYLEGEEIREVMALLKESKYLPERSR